MMNPELQGKGKFHYNQQQRVGVHLVENVELIIELNETISTNQTGQFPIVSQKGNQYTMVLFNYNSNAILVEGCKERTVLEYKQQHY